MKRSHFINSMLIAVAVVCATTAYASEETAEPATSAGIEETVFVESPILLRSLVRLPDDFDPDESHTLVIALHGFGSSPERFSSVGDSLTGAGFLFAAPQAPYALAGEEEVGFGWDFTHFGGTRFDHRASELTIDYIANLVEELQSRYTIDDVFLLGFSQGAAYSYVAGIYRHELFSGLICFGFGFEKDWFPGGLLEAAAGLKVFIAHATDDRRVPIEDSKSAANTLDELGYDVTYLEYVGGHRLEPGAVATAVTWLQKQTESQEESNR